ncbi:hypothetical protein BDV25DRAFT_145189 [Aspergillus avenaceus]|uniref:Alpha/Beta hydrolase protein n=1 Tax=Aspergillus avenaceus TaxID=36643 RepID=A0A5N6TF45_ASPAV|nr:hypothetical protein BDV25DRAFT_145189 [Aspergillus avenaceus]
MADPLENAYETVNSLPSVSEKTYPIAGILVTVFGLEELPSHVSEVACLWLLHPRLATKERMSGFATAAITDWNIRAKTDSHDDSNLSAKGLIAIAFDQRNHGTRLVEPLANEAWRQGNPRHAQDMFSIFQGTARDVSLLLDYLPSYVFPDSGRRVCKNLVLGVSLGGHAAWSCILHEPRVSAGVVIIGCPDYVNLMMDRARLSKHTTWMNSDPPGSQFLGSEAFPTPLLSAIRKYDPASLVFNHLHADSGIGPSCKDPLPEPTEQEKQALRPTLTRCLAGKKILNLSGGSDRLVPYHCGESFLTWLKKASAPDGWFADGAMTLEDVIVEGAAHQVTPKMVSEAVRFISDTLSHGDSREAGTDRGSKM